MDERKKKALESAGFRVGDAADFLGMTDAERRLVELRLGIGRAIRRGREARNLTQKQLAAMIKSTQPRVARIEAADPEVSLDLMLRGFFAIGGRLSPDLTPSLDPAIKGEPA